MDHKFFNISILVIEFSCTFGFKILIKINCIVKFNSRNNSNTQFSNIEKKQTRRDFYLYHKNDKNSFFVVYN